ncbi:MAG: hypothetical protein COU29_03535 [Candidatus Magasanikbacteria bacterium CG10_big_fil_rev_8_21_14_0_10_36_32]|uniref:Uncharacterized protein n=1 Tax=Candidatus Magasanikbacteria bacterium CG10_big_fil_rev_8_21_14_0_10_36_32 TaxID=1974646 RepID=A0A2M6W5H5_9BACT|nr:MAG: hypothetical protein COU29_03535 [Candidatus Magasanikbacteria bacterium CG10_big_fil_rev_8_21_14_0_10_36_32]
MIKIIRHSLIATVGLMAGALLTRQLSFPWIVIGAIIWGISSLIFDYPLNPLYWFLGQIGLTFCLVFCVIFHMSKKMHH